MRLNTLSVMDRAELQSEFEITYIEGPHVAFAVAGHRRTGWPLVAVRAGDGRLLHSGLRTPDGRFFDIRGTLDENEFTQFLGGDISDASETALLAEQYRATGKEIERADFVLGLVYPDLPGTGAMEKRYAAWASELEDVCTKHGIWLTSDSPNRISVTVENGQESGFELSFCGLGKAWLNRYLPDRGYSPDAPPHDGNQAPAP